MNNGTTVLTGKHVREAHDIARAERAIREAVGRADFVDFDQELCPAAVSELGRRGIHVVQNVPYVGMQRINFGGRR